MQIILNHRKEEFSDDYLFFRKDDGAAGSFVGRHPGDGDIPNDYLVTDVEYIPDPMNFNPFDHEMDYRIKNGTYEDNVRPTSGNGERGEYYKGYFSPYISGGAGGVLNSMEPIQGANPNYNDAARFDFRPSTRNVDYFNLELGGQLYSTIFSRNGTQSSLLINGKGIAEILNDFRLLFRRITAFNTFVTTFPFRPDPPLRRNFGSLMDRYIDNNVFYPGLDRNGDTFSQVGGGDTFGTSLWNEKVTSKNLQKDQYPTDPDCTNPFFTQLPNTQNFALQGANTFNYSDYENNIPNLFPDRKPSDVNGFIESDPMLLEFCFFYNRRAIIDIIGKNI